MLLLVRSLFCLKRDNGLLDLTIEFIARLFELIEALTEAAGQLRQAFGAEQDKNDQQNKKDLGPAGSTER